MQKIKHGSGFRGVLDYAFEREKGSKQDAGILIGGNMTGTTPRQLAAEFGAVARLRPDIEKPVWHQSLRLPVGEQLEAAHWVRLGDRYMELMGFTEKNQRCYNEHNDPEGQHIHIIANRIDIDGQVHNSSHESMKSTQIVARLEAEFGLTITPTANPEQRPPRLKKGEIERALRTGEAPSRLQMAALVEAAIEGGCDAVEFCERLEAAGVIVRPNVSPTTGRLNGFAFELNSVSFKGSQVGSSLSDLTKKGLVYEQIKHRERLIQRRDSGEDRANPLHGGDAAPFTSTTRATRPNEQADRTAGAAYQGAPGIDDQKIRRDWTVRNDDPATAKPAGTARAGGVLEEINNVETPVSNFDFIQQRKGVNTMPISKAKPSQNAANYPDLILDEEARKKRIYRHKLRLDEEQNIYFWKNPKTQKEFPQVRLESGSDGAETLHPCGKNDKMSAANMLSIARERDWEAMKVFGSESFQRAIFDQAVMEHGIGIYADITFEDEQLNTLYKEKLEAAKKWSQFASDGFHETKPTTEQVASRAATGARLMAAVEAKAAEAARLEAEAEANADNEPSAHDLM